jgi:hypothetical protein
LGELPRGASAGHHLRVPPDPASQLAATSTPTGAAFDIVLLLHVACVLIGFASVLTTGIQAWRARAGPGSSAAGSVARYFRPGINWPGRSLYLVLVLGLALVAISQRAYGFGDAFVELGFVFWILAIGLAELVVWPGERQLQRMVTEGWGGESAAAPGGSDGSGGSGVLADVRGTAVRVAIAAWAVCGVLVVAIVLMVQKP